MTTVFLYLISNYVGHALVDKYGLTEDKYRMSEGWGVWGVTVVVQYGHMVNILASFRLMLFLLFTLIAIGSAIITYFSSDA